MTVSPPRRPSDLAKLSEVELVRAVVSRDATFKTAGALLKQRPPNAEAAELVVAELDAQRLSPWLAAYLLGCLRHPIGYSTVLAILRQQPDSNAAEYAGAGLVAIAGESAVEDLIDLLLDGAERSTRGGAAGGLARLKSAPARDALLKACRDGLLGARAAGSALESYDFSDDDLASLLESGSAALVRAALEVLHRNVASAMGPEDSRPRWHDRPLPHTAAAVGRVLEDEDLFLPRLVREDLLRWSAS